jgi:hypothetical protein
MKQIYRITYLVTGKIYIGKLAYESFRYFVSPSKNVVDEDFRKLPIEQQKDYSVRKEILWESATCTDSELSVKEIEYIKMYQSNNPSIGYNRWPKFNENS